MLDYDPNDPMHLPNWFDPYSTEHLEAYRVLRQRGYWPKPFMDLMDQLGIVIPDGWQMLLESRLASCWLADRIDKECCPKCGRASVLVHNSHDDVRCDSCGYRFWTGDHNGSI